MLDIEKLKLLVNLSQHSIRITNWYNFIDINNNNNKKHVFKKILTDFFI
jgi:hypothetical protein